MATKVERSELEFTSSVRKVADALIQQSLSGEHAGQIGIYLMALRVEEDLRSATSELAWSRGKKWSASIKVR